MVASFAEREESIRYQIHPLEMVGVEDGVPIVVHLHRR